MIRRSRQENGSRRRRAAKRACGCRCHAAGAGRLHRDHAPHTQPRRVALDSKGANTRRAPTVSRRVVAARAPRRWPRLASARAAFAGKPPTRLRDLGPPAPGDQRARSLSISFCGPRSPASRPDRLAALQPPPPRGFPSARLHFLLPHRAGRARRSRRPLTARPTPYSSAASPGPAAAHRCPPNPSRSRALAPTGPPSLSSSRRAFNLDSRLQAGESTGLAGLQATERIFESNIMSTLPMMANLPPVTQQRPGRRVGALRSSTGSTGSWRRKAGTVLGW